MDCLKTFGKVSLCYKDVQITEEQINSDMMQKLIVYLAYHRHTFVEASKIMSDLWNEGQTDNPAGALKNLAYRIRTFMKKFFPDEQFVIFNHGTYYWNSELDITLDCEEFDKLAKMAKGESDYFFKLHLLEQAEDLYEGEFLQKYNGFDWINQIRTYYHLLYLEVIKSLCELYESDQRYEKIIYVCNKALVYEKLDEGIYYYLIRAYANTNNLQVGLEVYERARRRFIRELGSATRCELLQEAYEELIKSQEIIKKSNMRDVMQMLDIQEEKSFFCSFAVFREIYQFQKRISEREHKKSIIVLMTLEFPNTFANSKMELFVANKIVNSLIDITGTALRKGDVVSRLSEYQFLILLSNCDERTFNVVCERIQKMFTEMYPQYGGCKLVFENNMIEYSV